MQPFTAHVIKFAVITFILLEYKLDEKKSEQNKKVDGVVVELRSTEFFPLANFDVAAYT